MDDSQIKCDEQKSVWVLNRFIVLPIKMSMGPPTDVENDGSHISKSF